ncbi:hypothetical protein J2X53_003864 [Pseudorhodobacter sp. 4114]|nr:hypothetical protein [Pseudorhodobacter sp. 4114]
MDRVGQGKEGQINMRFLAMTNHYVYEPEFRNPAAGWEKGQVEKNVRHSRQCQPTLDHSVNQNP